MGDKLEHSKELTRVQSLSVPRTVCSRLGRYLSLLAVTAMLCCIWIGSDKLVANKSTTIIFIHLLSFAAHFGAQCWVTFVAGFAMFFSLPRIMFGHLQSTMFPLYFTITLVLSCVTLQTYTIRHPYATMTSSETKELTALCVCVASTFINSFYIAPEIVDSMIDVFEIEKASGVAYVVGYCDRTELKKDPKYSEHYKRFRWNHSISGVANLVTLICNTIYLYQLANINVTLDVEKSYCTG